MVPRNTIYMDFGCRSSLGTKKRYHTSCKFSNSNYLSLKFLTNKIFTHDAYSITGDHS